MDRGLTYVDYYPEYASVARIDIVFDLITILIIAMLMVQILRRKHNTKEVFMFRRILICNLIMAVCGIAEDAQLLYRTLDRNTLAGVYVSAAFVEIFTLVLVAQWLLFVEFTLHQSMDIIKRRYPRVSIPFFAAVALQIISILLLLPFNGTPEYSEVADLLNTISYLVMFFYIMASYIVLSRERGQNKIPQYIRVTPTVICMVAGIIIDWFLTEFRTQEIGFAIGLLFADYFMFRRLSFIDPQTGFFIRKYLPELEKAASKKKIEGGTVFHFRAPEDSGKMAAIIRAWEPYSSRVVTMGDGMFLVIAEALKESLAETFISHVRKNAQEEGLQVEAGYEIWKEGPVPAEIRRIASE
ncbi:MAG: hypothetical protein K6B72_02585 [Lachnospiraceae bacterium]|nr:hypothetical protein [Lachnospiraceae bacterium]